MKSSAVRALCKRDPPHWMGSSAGRVLSRPPGLVPQCFRAFETVEQPSFALLRCALHRRSFRPEPALVRLDLAELQPLKIPH
jgi:hypothetical protein